MEFEPLIHTSEHYYQEYEEEEADDNLSFCHFLLGENDSGSNSIQPSPRASSVQQTDHSFEFFTSRKTNTKPNFEEQEMNEYQKRDYFSNRTNTKSMSFHNLSLSDHRPPSPSRFSGELTRGSSMARDVSYHAQRVNISALTSMSTSSKRRMFMFGPVKFKPEMELSEIKQRQGRRRNAAEKSGGGRKSRWEVARASLCERSHFRGVLARSFGCGPMATGVAN